MISHSENRLLMYSPDDMLRLVSDIEKYPEFIPWCDAVRVNSRSSNITRDFEILDADMMVSFKVFREKFSSKVTINKSAKCISVEYLNGPFKFLRNSWEFVPSGKNCEVCFEVEFEFRSKTMQRIIGFVFQDSMKKIVKAFEERAAELYTEPT